MSRVCKGFYKVVLLMVVFNILEHTFEMSDATVIVLNVVFFLGALAGMFGEILEDKK